MGLFSSSTKTENPLWDIQAPHLQNIATDAQNIYQQGTPGYYPGQTVAGFDPVRAQGLNLGVDAALGPQQQLANAYTSGLLGIAQGTDPTAQRLAQQAGAAVGQAAVGAGSLGSARANLAQNTAAGDVIADRQLEALGQIPQAQTAALAPAQTLSKVGTTFQDYQQRLSDADKSRYDYGIQQPWNWLGQYQKAIGTPQATTTTTESPSLFNTITGGLSTLGGLGFFAEGGQVPTTQQGKGIYSPVPVQAVDNAPQSNYGWAIVNGRYQLVPGDYGGAQQPGGGDNYYTPPSGLPAPTPTPTPTPSGGGSSAPSPAGHPGSDYTPNLYTPTPIAVNPHVDQTPAYTYTTPGIAGGQTITPTNTYVDPNAPLQGPPGTPQPEEVWTTPGLVGADATGIGGATQEAPSSAGLINQAAPGTEEAVIQPNFLSDVLGTSGQDIHQVQADNLANIAEVTGQPHLDPNYDPTGPNTCLLYTSPSPRDS